MATPSTPSTPGVGVDASGNAVLDPTANVLALVDAAVIRLNDLVACNGRRIDDMRELNAQHAREMQVMHANYQDQLRLAESKRIDAIRAVDVAAVGVAADRAAAQAGVLAAQVAASAETLRALVATTQTALASQLQQMSTAFTERLAALEKAQYESKGKSGVTDPAMAELVAEMRAMTKLSSVSTGKTEGVGMVWSAAIGAGGIIIAVIAVFTFFSTRPAALPVYLPAPTQAVPK